MAKIVVSLSCLVVSLLMIITLIRADRPTIHRRSRARAFIEAQCHTTLYPDVCTRSLSIYATNFTTLSHQKLAQIAVKVSLAKAESTRAYVTGLANHLSQTKDKDYLSVKECLDRINDGVDLLTNCIKETQRIKEDGESSNDFSWRESNVKTWMSTTITDVSVCVDGFSGRVIGGKSKAVIKAKVLNLQQVTSIALALFNRFAARYRSSHVIKP